MIVTYDRQNMFIIQATVLLKMFQKVDKEKNHYDEKSPKSKKPYRLKLYMTSWHIYDRENDGPSDRQNDRHVDI